MNIKIRNVYESAIDTNINNVIVERNSLMKENIKLHSIIKEVREIFKYYGAKEDIVGYSNYTITGEDLIKLLEILDKVGEE